MKLIRAPISDFILYNYDIDLDLKTWFWKHLKGNQVSSRNPSWNYGTFCVMWHSATSHSFMKITTILISREW